VAHGLSKVHQKNQKKVGSNSEGVEEVVRVLALSPRWWFAWAAVVGVVVAVSCFHEIV
jgi:hypothetical protein